MSLRKAPLYTRDANLFNVAEVEIFILTEERATERKDKVSSPTSSVAAESKVPLGFFEKCSFASVNCLGTLIIAMPAR